MSENKKEKASRVLNYGPIAPSEVELVTPLQKEFSLSDNNTSLPGNIVPFFTRYNDYALQLVYAASLSSTHLSCIESKVFYAKGDGFIIRPGRPSRLIIEGESKKVKPQQIEKLTDLYEAPNAENESLLDVYERLLIDDEFIGNYYVLLKRVKSGDTSRVYIIHLPATNCLVTAKATSADEQFVCYHPDWSAVSSEPLKDKNTRKYPIYPKFGKVENADANAEYSVIHGKRYIPGKSYYGLPRSIASLIWQQNENEIGQNNADDLFNGFSADSIIQGVSSDEQSKVRKFRSAIENTFTKRAGNGRKKKVFINIASDESGLLKVDTLASNRKDGAYLELDKLSTQKILTAHRWYASLAGIPESGKLSSPSDAIINDYQIAFASVTRPTQNHFIEKVFAIYLKENDVLDAYYDITNSMPVSFMGKIDVDGVLTDDELRQELGYSAATDEQKKELSEKRKKKNDSANNSKRGN